MLDAVLYAGAGTVPGVHKLHLFGGGVGGEGFGPQQMH
jgi:hypothetical protein